MLEFRLDVVRVIAAYLCIIFFGEIISKLFNISLKTKSLIVQAGWSFGCDGTGWAVGAM